MVAAAPAAPAVRADTRFAAATAAVFVIVLSFSIAGHEMWRDEMQAWLLARDSASLADLFANIRYEGHPALWHIMLWGLARIGATPIAMQALHVGIAAASVFIVARSAPLPRWQRAVFAAGYFPLFEYGVISRNYALGMLLVVAFCAAFPERHRRPARVGLLVLLLANTSIPATIIAIAICAALTLEYRRPATPNVGAPGVRDQRQLLAPAIGICGVFLAVAQVLPPYDSGYATEWYFGFDWWRLKHTVRLLAQALVPIPDLQGQFWGSRLAERIPNIGEIEAVLSALVLGAFVLALRRTPVALTFFLTATMGLLAFFYLKTLGQVRHHGFLFLVALASVWMVTSYRRVASAGAPAPPRGRRNVVASFAIASILILQAAGGVIATELERRTVFSHGRSVAAYLEGQHLDELPLIGEPDYTASVVAGFLPGRPVHYVRGNRAGTFVRWDQARIANPSDSAIVAAAAAINAVTLEPVLLVLNRALLPSTLQGGAVAEIRTFTGAAVVTENAFLYAYDPGRLLSELGSAR